MPSSTTPSSPSGGDPRAEHARRLEEHRATAEAAARRAERLSLLRLLAFALLLVLAWLGLRGTMGWLPALATLSLFAALVVVHGRARRREDAARLRAGVHAAALDRMEGRWAGTGPTGEDLAPAHHPYALDLDLVGEGSLFQLLCTARTRAGRETLAGWLLEGAPLEEARARQAAVAELRDDLDLREDMAIVGGEVSSASDRAQALAWGRAPTRLPPGPWPWLFLVVGLATTTLVVSWAFLGGKAAPALLALLVQGALAMPFGRRVGDVLADADRPAQDLALVGRLLARLERGRWEAPWLQELAGRLRAGGHAPSVTLGRLVRRLEFVEARRNQIFLPVSWLLNLGTLLAFSIERWRAAHGEHLVTWVDALGRFEAILALAGYAYEHPADPFPTLEPDEVCFEAESLGHPLLDDAVCVRNDLRLGLPADEGRPQACLVSGSNMSGKSTLLRTVGVSCVLARAGAPVRARRLRLAPLDVGASIRVQDSLREGASRFYAEIERLKEVVDIARRDGPALFLLDEVLHGTNSHDRRIGAAAVVASLLDAGALGLVTTHDLALADIAASDARLRNVHFEDRIEEGRILFDYRLRPGVVTRSNAIELMRSVGLDVGEDDGTGGGDEG